MLKKLIMVGAVAAAAFLQAATVANAQSVDDIIKKGELVVGTDLTNAPWGFLDDKQEPAGFDPALAKLIADKMGVKLKLERVTGPTRIPFLLTGRVDMVISTLSMTAERARQVWFTTPYSPLPHLLIGDKDKSYATYDQLKGVRISTVRGSPMDATVTKKAPDAVMMRFDDDASAQQALMTGQADLLAGGSLVPSVLNKMQPGKDYKQKILMDTVYMGMAVRKGSDDLHQYLNTLIFLIKQSGELDALYQKQFGEPMGPLPVF